MAGKYYVNTNCVNKESQIEAFRFALELIHDEKVSSKNIIFYLYTKNFLPQDIKLFSKEKIKQIFKNGLRCGDLIITGNTSRTINGLCYFEEKNEIVIAFYVNSKELYKLDDHFKTIIVIPSNTDNIIDWAKRWGATEITSGISIEKTYPPDIVKVAMSDLTRDIYSLYSKTDITNPDDLKKAIRCIKTLHKYVASLDPDIIENYLASDLKWLSKDAHKINELITSISHRKYSDCISESGMENTYKSWTEEVKKLD